MKRMLNDTIGILGAASVVYGGWLAWHPAGFVIGGALAMVGAFGARSVAKGGCQ